MSANIMYDAKKEIWNLDSGAPKYVTKDSKNIQHGHWSGLWFIDQCGIVADGRPMDISRYLSFLSHNDREFVMNDLWLA